MNSIRIRKRIDALLTEKKLSIEQLEEEKNKLETVQQLINDTIEAQNIAQHISQIVQQQAHEKISNVVTKCLEAVFGEDYGFKINFERKRGRTEAKLILLKGGHEIDEPLNADSGGVVDVGALALRLSGIVLSKPALKHVILMDEPFRNLDTTNRRNMRLLLEELANNFKVQFIIVTHEVEFQTGKMIRI